MTYTRTIILSTILTGCMDIPAGSQPIDDVPDALAAFHRTVEAWNSAGLPEAVRDACSTENVYVATLAPDAFRSATKFCDDSVCDASCNGRCALAYRLQIKRAGRDDVVIILTESLTPQERQEAYAHETTHYLAGCTGYMSDHDVGHTDRLLWGAGGVVAASLQLCRMDGDCQ